MLLPYTSLLLETKGWFVFQFRTCVTEEIQYLLNAIKKFKKIIIYILTTICFLCLSSLEEDPLYIAYADMMAKVLSFLHYFWCLIYSKILPVFFIIFSLSELC